MLTDSLAEAISESDVHGDVLHVRGVLNEIVHCRNKLGYVYVIDSNGRVLAHTFGRGFSRSFVEKRSPAWQWP